jgi:hypothetical protein
MKKEKTIDGRRRLSAAWLLGLPLFVVACGGSPGGRAAALDAPSVDDPFAGIELSLSPATACTFQASSGLMVVTVGAGETAILAKRATDSVIVQNGAVCDNPAKVGTLKRIEITADSGDSTVVIDYTNGLFATGSSSATSGVAVDMGSSAGNDVFGVIGTSVADLVSMGTNGIAMNGDAYATRYPWPTAPIPGPQTAGVAAERRTSVESRFKCTGAQVTTRSTRASRNAEGRDSRRDQQRHSQLCEAWDHRHAARRSTRHGHRGQSVRRR